MLPNLSHSSSSEDVVGHIPVMATEVAELLELRPGDTVVDCTFGAGGHAALLEPRLRGSGTYIAIDRDPDVEPYFATFANGATSVARFMRGDFALVLRNMATTGQRAHAVLMDLGMSSMQVDRADRGFSYANDAPLDMRMDPTAELTAADIVNGWSERELSGIFRELGEERFARQIARSIVRRRATRPFTRSSDLVDVIKSAIPTPSRFGQGHPAKRVFQALRIATNDELESLREGLDAALDVLEPGGRIAVISFHSLEDRIVKRFMRDAARGCTCPPDFPVCVCGHSPLLRSLTNRAVVPSVEERGANPRSSSAKLRASERTGGGR
jgi:16S rRNA (cytosine1402-N4)-methyltransferase